MLIECTLKRKGGSAIELSGKTYHFRPDKDGRHVCNIEVESAVKRLLKIPESFRDVNAPEKAPEEPVAPAPKLPEINVDKEKAPALVKYAKQHFGTAIDSGSGVSIRETRRQFRGAKAEWTAKH